VDQPPGDWRPKAIKSGNASRNSVPIPQERLGVPSRRAELSSTSTGLSRSSGRTAPRARSSSLALEGPSPKVQPVQPRPKVLNYTRLTGLSSGRKIEKPWPGSNCVRIFRAERCPSSETWNEPEEEIRPMPTTMLDPQSVRHALETHGSRCTPQRLAVYEFLSHADHHPTAEQVYQGVRSLVPRISLATVYKALEALVCAGVASKLSGGVGGETSARYDARLDRHYHFYCGRTGKVHDLPTEFDTDLIEKLDPKLSDYLQPAEPPAHANGPTRQ
jgi:Fur family peroxide stress response transcriptional regulator